MHILPISFKDRRRSWDPLWMSGLLSCKARGRDKEGKRARSVEVQTILIKWRRTTIIPFCFYRRESSTNVGQVLFLKGAREVGTYRNTHEAPRVVLDLLDSHSRVEAQPSPTLERNTRLDDCESSQNLKFDQTESKGRRWKDNGPTLRLFEVPGAAGDSWTGDLTPRMVLNAVGGRV